MPGRRTAGDRFGRSMEFLKIKGIANTTVVVTLAIGLEVGLMALVVIGVWLVCVNRVMAEEVQVATL